MGQQEFDEYLAWGRDVLSLEGRSIVNATEALDHRFSQAVQLILVSQGKLVVTGIGKSGHVGRKISSTLASTGTPSIFLHPSEALHGDLGMIETHDLLLAIAHSGETPEVSHVVKYCQRAGHKTILLSGSPQSSIAQMVDLSVIYPQVPEACPLNLAPTCSSTMCLALGDALAVTLMRARRFGKRDFARYHPAGKLGRETALVGHYIRPELAMISHRASFDEVIEAVTAMNFGIATVRDEADRLIGVITDGDVRRALKHKRNAVFSMIAGDLMTRSPKTIRRDQLAIDAIEIMEKSKVTALLVTDDSEKLCGVVRMHDLLEQRVI